MSDVIFQGWHHAQQQGLLTATPDVRLKLVMSGFTGESEEDSINIADLTALDEFDGIGYLELDCENVDMSYDTASDEMRLDFDDGEFNAVDGSSTPGSDDAVGIVAYLYVDGTDANDILLGFTDSGGFPFNAANNALQLTVPSGGFMFVRQAA